MGNHNKIPRLRFPDYKGEWSKKKLCEIAVKKSQKNVDGKINEVFTNSATQGVISQREYFDRDIANLQNLYGYYLIEKDDFVYNPRISVSAPVGPISRNLLGVGVMSPLYTVLKIINGNLDFLEIYFKTTKWHSYLKNVANYGVRFDRMNLTNNDLFSMPLYIPAEKEQKKIADLFRIIEQKLIYIKVKKSLLEKYKKGVMKKLFSQELRFKDDNGEEFPDWQNKKLSEYLEVSKTKNIKGLYNKNDVLSVSGEYGIINQIEYQGRSFAGVSVLNYGVVETGDIVYTKSPLKESPYGIIKVNKGRTGIVSTLYAVYKCKNTAVGEYIDYYFQLHETLNGYLRPLVHKGAKNDMKINNERVLIDSINFPCKKEQLKIVNFLSLIDNKINHVSEQIEKMEDWKNGLMQQMFV
jgi:type I restriction enzyme S subunit